ncbi:MAG: PSD1 and planctomycete cytochrome C domain-containing protein [Bryobacteraceae bacterium]
MPHRAALLLLSWIPIAWAGDAREEFELRVRPVLAKNCYSCHTESKLGGLRLDSRDAILKGGASGPAIVPKKPDESLLVQAIEQRHARLKMPPSSKLRAGEIAALREWIQGGAYWPPAAVPPVPENAARYRITPEQRAFWSFQPVVEPAPPKVRHSNWVKSPIDQFVLARLEEKNLQPAPAAGKRTLLRRATIDLTGLPPTPEEVSAFLADNSPDAFSKVIDRLLNSPRYGERWGRHWLDVARYADDRLNSTQDEPYANAFRYRDWVIRALNDDMPYDRFLKAQIAGDLMKSDDPGRYAAGTGFFALSPEFQDERVDALSRGFLGLTVACAQCHNHKFDPIPTRDYYALQGIFESSHAAETPLAPAAEVERYNAKKKEIDQQEERITRFYQKQTLQLAEMLASQTARYLLAARGLGPADGLEKESLDRWVRYLKEPRKEHPYLKPWYELRDDDRDGIEREAKRLGAFISNLFEERQRIEKENEIRLGLNPSRNDLANASLVSLERNKYVFWRDLFAKGEKDSAGFFASVDGIYYYGKGKIESLLDPRTNAYLAGQKAVLETLKKELPAQYPFLHTMKENDKPEDIHIAIRGDRNNKGDLAPRAFLTVLAADGQPQPFRNGSGRLELAEAIASPGNPLTARVMANRLWQEHFGRGIVNTPGNFGQLGERPSHPELLDYLASRFVKNGWSLKAMHREMMLSATYQLSASRLPANEAVDADNQLYWRANRRRMDAETIRDALQFVAGTLDLTPAEKTAKLDDANRHRTIYGQISRRKTDPYLSLFDFPNPNGTSEKRIPTSVPPQRLFFMNSPFVENQAKALAGRLTGDPRARIEQAYRIVYGRAPDVEEARLALGFLERNGWPQYARALVSSNEFLFVD